MDDGWFGGYRDTEEEGGMLEGWGRVIRVSDLFRFEQQDTKIIINAPSTAVVCV